MANKNVNPYQGNMGTVTETYKPDGSRQANIKTDGGSFQVNQGADGNVAFTKTQTVDFSKVMPFTSVQPMAGAMDQIFGTKMAQHSPSQSAMVQNYRMLQGKEADPLADLKRQALQNQIANQKEAMKLRERGLKAQEKNAAARLAETQENRALRKGLQLDKKVNDYAKWIDESGIPELNSTIKEIERITSANKDLPGFGQTGMVPDLLVSQEGEDLRSSVGNLFNITLKDRSGAAVTDQELTRLKKEFEDGKWKTDDALRRGLTKYVTRLKEKMRNIQAGTDPEAVTIYQQSRGGADFLGDMGRANFMYGDSAPEMAQGPEVGTVKNGYVFQGGDPSQKENWIPQESLGGN